MWARGEAPAVACPDSGVVFAKDPWAAAGIKAASGVPQVTRLARVGAAGHQERPLGLTAQDRLRDGAGRLPEQPDDRLAGGGGGEFKADRFKGDSDVLPRPLLDASVLFETGPEFF